MPRRRLPRNPMRSQDPAAAAWRSEQADVDADIAGLARDPEDDRLVSEMDAASIPVKEQIERIKAYFKTLGSGKPTAASGTAQRARNA